VEDDTELRMAILRILSQWGRLPESDILRRLAPEQLARLRSAVLDHLAAEGLVEVRAVGDERVVTLTAQGRAAVEQSL
jgi:hypothetical protein